MSTLIPALPPPPGIQSNFENPQSKCYLTVIPCAAMVGIMIIFVFVRMYTKAYVLKSVGWDDYTCIFAALSSVVCLGFLMALYELGFGVHQWDITYTNLESLTSKEGKSLSALWGPSMFFTKLSLLLLFYRIFSPDRVTKYLVVFGILYCFVLYTSFLLLTFLLCQSARAESCVSEWKLFILISSGLNIFSDIYLIILPLTAVAKLHMPFRQKLGVSAMFFTGLLACVSGILALYYRIRLLRIRDATWHTTPVSIFTFMEINTGIVVSCMPTMPALIQDIRSQVSGARKPNQRHRSPSQSPSHNHASIDSRSKSCMKKNSSHDTQRQVRFDVENRQSPQELDSTPVQMEEAHVRVPRSHTREPRSYFSDDSSALGTEDLEWLS